MTQAAPGHVQEVRRLVFDPLTKTQTRQLREISRRITAPSTPRPPPLRPALPAGLVVRAEGLAETVLELWLAERRRENALRSIS